MGRRRIRTDKETQGALPLDPSRDAVPAPCKGVPPLTLLRDSVERTSMLCPRVYPVNLRFIKTIPQKYGVGDAPKVSKGRSESPLVASAEAKPLQHNRAIRLEKQPSALSKGDAASTQRRPLLILFLDEKAQADGAVESGNSIIPPPPPWRPAPQTPCHVPPAASSADTAESASPTAPG